MKWNQASKIAELFVSDITSEATRIPKWRSPLVGGLSPQGSLAEDELSFIRSPSVIIAEFDFEPTGPNPSITLFGSGLRPFRARDDIDVNLETKLVPIDFERKTIQLDNSVKKVEWFFEGPNIRAPNSRKYLQQDPKLIVCAEIQSSNHSVKVRITNKGPDVKHSYLHNFKFKIQLNSAQILLNSQGKPEDIPLHIETTNAVAYLEGKQTIALGPFGLWNQKKLQTVAGPTFKEALEKQYNLPEGALGKFKDDFDWAARITTNAMSRIVSPSKNYYKFQFDLRSAIYENLVRGWNDHVLRVIIDNAPTAAGKTEVNFEASISASLVLKKHASGYDCGTVAIISEPIRALTAEQLERLFRFMAFVNEQLPTEMKLSMGFFMGTQEGKGVPYEPSRDLEGRLDKIPINNCPFCNHELSLKFYPNESRLIPECDMCNPKRKFDWVFLTIRETQDFLPNIVVATLDKLCFEEARPNTAVHTFYGREYVRCRHCNRVTPVTGKVVDNLALCRNCNHSLDIANARRSQFSIFVLDEAHTFRGSLGSNASLYTTSELQLSMSISNKAPLVIASTATVNKADQLMTHLTGARECIILPDPKKCQEIDYFHEVQQNHRQFIFTCANVSNRVAIPKAISAVKAAWNSVRTASDPERLPQIVFTKKRQNAENLRNAIQVLGDEDQWDLKSEVIHGESEKPLVKSALEKVRKNEIDVLFVTIDLIALGIDIPSISVIHFDGITDDFAKFVQAYGRSARGMTTDEGGLILIWLRMNIPGEAYYFEHFRDLFLYKNELMPVVPINRWFPQSIRTYIPAATVQYGFFNDRRASLFSPTIAARRFTDPVYKSQVQGFLEKMLGDSANPEDMNIAQKNILLGLQDLTSHIEGQSVVNMRFTSELLERILPFGIRSQSGETIIIPTNINKALMSVRIEKSLLSAGYKPEEIGVEGEEY